MKKILVLISVIIIITCLTFTACDPGSYQFEHNDLANNVVRVELINYDNPDQKQFVSWVPDHSSKLLPFNKSNMTILEQLDESRIDDFLSQLSEEDILSEYYVFNSPKGICLKLTYANDDFMIITSDYENEAFYGYIGKYTADGEVSEFIGSFSSYSSFESLVNNYFETKLN